jgi:hypothetical protein
LPFQVTATVPPRPVREETRTPEPVSLGTLGARATRPEIDELLDVMPDQELAYLAVEATRLVKRRLVRGQGRGLRPKAGGRGKSPLDDALRRIGGELMEFEGPWRRVVSRCGVRNSRNTLGGQARPYQPRGEGSCCLRAGLEAENPVKWDGAGRSGQARSVRAGGLLIRVGTTAEEASKYVSTHSAAMIQESVGDTTVRRSLILFGPVE